MVCAACLQYCAVVKELNLVLSAAVCLQLSSFLPSATPLPELKAIATSSFAGLSTTLHTSAACISQEVSLPVP